MSHAPELIGWASSLILFLTLAQQVWKQWRERSTTGVSRWLFVGQLAASAGFTMYSVLKRDWVFVTTNAAMLANAVVGCLVLRHNKRR
jgi:MtN3 and saliva related transmembrane protein